MRISAVIILLFGTVQTGLANESISFPTVPALVVQQYALQNSLVAQTEPGDEQESATSTEMPIKEKTIANVDQRDLTKYAQEPLILEMTPGDSELVYITQGVNNQIVTPFEFPKVRTANDVSVTIDGASIFVATERRNFFSLYVYEDGYPDQGVTLSLLPSSIPPKQIQIRIASNGNHMATQNNVAKRFEKEADSYVTLIMDIMESVASGRLPTGYEYADDLGLAYCASPLTMTPYQRMIGSEYEVLVLHARNNTSLEEEFLETDCVVEGVIAVSSFPRLKLQPGEDTEIFVIRMRLNTAVDPLYRPSSVSY